MSWGAVAGGAISAAGSLMGSSSPQAAQFKPWNVQGGLLGQATFQKGKKGKPGTIDVAPTEAAGALGDQFLQMAQSNLFGQNPLSAMSQVWSGAGAGGILPGYDAMMGLPQFGAQAAYNAAPMYGLFSQAANLYGQQGLGQAFGAPTAAPLTAFAANQAAALGGGSFNQLAAERLSALRSQAQPLEDQAAYSTINKLHAMGRLGTTGGAQDLEAMQRGLAQADFSRIQGSQDFAQQQFNIQQQLAQGYLGQGLTGIGQDISRGLGLGGLGQGLFGMGTSLLGNQVQAYGMGDEMAMSRAQQRMAAAQGLFGFGQGVQDTLFNRALQQIGGAQSIDSASMEAAKLGASVGQAQAAAGANAAALASPSPFASALQGFGAGISGANLSGIFGSRNTPTYTEPLNIWAGSGYSPR